jgi:hypothetical protein
MPVTLATSWNSSKTTRVRKPPDSSSFSGRSSRAWSAGSGSVWGLDPGADPERAERETDPRALEEGVDGLAERTFQVARVGPLDPDRDIRDGENAIEIDHHRDETLLALAVVEHASQQTRLPELARRVQANVVTAYCPGQELLRLLVPVDDVRRRNRTRVEERVGVRDHGEHRITSSSVPLN